MLSILFGLLSALTWGAGDFCGGLAAKRAHVYGVVIIADLLGGALLFALGLLFGDHIPVLSDWLWSAIAGVVGGIGLLALYRALATQRMGLASPVAAVITAMIPVVFGVFVQGLPQALTLLGFGVGLASVWLVSAPSATAFRWQSLWADVRLPAIAGLGFGLFLVCITRVNPGSAFWTLAIARLTTIVVLVGVAAVTRQTSLPKRQDLWLIALVGVLDAAGNAFFVLAAQAGRLDVASVLSSLYPASTVWLAWLVLKERLTLMQWLGVGAALVAIVLIAV